MAYSRNATNRAKQLSLADSQEVSFQGEERDRRNQRVIALKAEGTSCKSCQHFRLVGFQTRCMKLNRPMNTYNICWMHIQAPKRKKEPSL